MDNLLSAFNLVVSAIYLYLAVGPAYATSGWRRVAATLVLALAAPAIVLGYRFVLFVITLYAH